MNATKNFNQLSTKKLNALLATANESDKAKIMAILEARKQIANNSEEIATGGVDGVTSVEMGDELTPDEENALKAAEENGGINPMYEKNTNKRKISDSELDTLFEQLKVNINHKVQVVPFNTIEWIDGYIVSLIKEKRANKILYAIKTDDGRRIVKVHDSKLIKIFDEVVEPEKKARKKSDGVKVEWEPEMITDEVNKVIGNVGKVVKFEKYHVGDNSDDIETTGRIIGVVPDKRAQCILYRISIAAPTADDPEATKIVHKVVTADSLNISDEFDEVGAKMNEKYCERRNNLTNKIPATPQDRVIKCEENLKKAQEKLQKAQSEVDAKLAQLEAAKKELDEYLTTQENSEPLA